MNVGNGVRKNSWQNGGGGLHTHFGGYFFNKVLRTLFALALSFPGLFAVDCLPRRGELRD